MTISSPAPGRTARDIQLSRALGIVALTGLITLIVGLWISPPFGQDGEPTNELIADWLRIASFLPFLAAAVLAIGAFRGGDQERARRLRTAAFLVAASFALEAGADLLTRATLEGPLPKGYKLALNASVLSTCGLLAAMLVAARAIAPERGAANRERGMGRAFQLVAAGYVFAMLSALLYASAYSNYPGHDSFTQGLKNQAFGALGVAVASAWAAAAFRRSARRIGVEGEPADRERRLSRAAFLLALSYLIIGLGEALVAAGSPKIGYSGDAESLSWVGAVAELATAVAIVFAAIGFRRAARD